LSTKTLSLKLGTKKLVSTTAETWTFLISNWPKQTKLRAHNTYDKLLSSNGTHWRQNQLFLCLELVSTKTFFQISVNQDFLSLSLESSHFLFFSQTRDLEIKNFWTKIEFSKNIWTESFNVKSMTIKVNFSCHFLNDHQFPLFFHFSPPFFSLAFAQQIWSN
jgi:hypothetical protein